MRQRTIVLGLITTVLVLPLAARAEDLKFVLHRVGSFRSEACGVGDFNNDGKPDIVAGAFLYLAPDFKPHKIRSLKGSVDDHGKGYYWDFMNEPMDVDGDGKLDVVSVDWFQMHCTWFRNIGTEGGDWPESAIEKNGNFECGELADLENSGKKTAIVPSVQRTVWYEVVRGTDGKPAPVVHVVSETKYDFGIGVGDLNGDGRNDLIRPGAWYEAPADIRRGQWIEHPLLLGDRDEKKPVHTPQILVYDVNGDGLNDLVTSSAHGYGIFWYEQVREGSTIHFLQHLIDDSWTQAHSLALADLDNDGVPELVTGKRFMAHNGNDPEEDKPLGLYYYSLQRGPKPTWTRHTISRDEGIGSGVNLCVADMDGDGDLDIVVTGKWGGPAWFENKLK
jgi:hypothetical protein